MPQPHHAHETAVVPPAPPPAHREPPRVPRAGAQRAVPPGAARRARGLRGARRARRRAGFDADAWADALDGYFDRARRDRHRRRTPAARHCSSSTRARASGRCGRSSTTRPATTTGASGDRRPRRLRRGGRGRRPRHPRRPPLVQLSRRPCPLAGGRERSDRPEAEVPVESRCTASARSLRSRASASGCRRTAGSPCPSAARSAR